MAEAPVASGFACPKVMGKQLVGRSVRLRLDLLLMAGLVKLSSILLPPIVAFKKSEDGYISYYQDDDVKDHPLC